MISGESNIAGLRRSIELASVVLVLVAAIGMGLEARGQQLNSVPRGAPVIVEVIATNKRTGAAAEGLSKSDFEVVEQHSATEITSFAHGSEGPVRPVALWFVVQCPEEHSYFNWISNGSGFMKGRTESFTHVLQKLNAQDTVGVAHWCDNGEFGLDLLPSTDRIAPQNILETVLDTKRTRIGGTPGENALHDVVLRIRESARQTAPNAQPVLVFLYGDHSGMHHDEANDMLDKPIGPLPLVYGINNGAVSIQRLTETDKYTQMYVVHFLSDRTGGQVLSSVRGNYDADLDRILGELRGRYEIGFTPQTAAGKHFELKVKLTKEARQRTGSLDLRYAPELVAFAPGAEGPESKAADALVEAMQASSAYTEIGFDASGRYVSGDALGQFRLYVDPNSLSWKAMENGDQQATVSLAMGGVSKQGVVDGYITKKFEVLQAKDERSGGNRKAVILSISYAVLPDAARVRFVIRDVTSNRMGSFELPVQQIHEVAAMKPSEKPTSDAHAP